MTLHVDLHVHSCHSDGLFTPVELVQKAAQRGLKAIAITDHDSVDGIDEAIEAGTRYGVEIIPAVELSVQHKDHHDVHLLGYLLDYRDEKFRRKLLDFRARRDERGRLIIDRINDRLISENSMTICYDDVVRNADGALGRPHIARELVSKGLARDVQDAFIRYLGPCDVPKQYFPMDDALAEIRRLGGISVLAHPLSISDDRRIIRFLIKELAEMGLDGIEVFNNMCYKDDIIFLSGLAAVSGLAMTGGSDFHGGEEGLDIGILRSGSPVGYDLVETISNLHRFRLKTDF